MARLKLDELRKKSKAELNAQLEELKAELKKLKEERSLPGAKVNKLPEELRLFLAEESKKLRAELQEAYRNREPLVLCLNSREDPSCTAASPPAELTQEDYGAIRELLDSTRL